MYRGLALIYGLHMDDETLKLLFNRDIYKEVIERVVLSARSTVWIATADVKDLHVKVGRGYRPILALFEEMAKGGVRFRIIHANIPSTPFRNTLEQLPTLVGGALELQICPRSHWKMVIVDHAIAYFGSANFTGAGIGVKSERRRNLEVGAITENPGLVRELSRQFDRFWMGDRCRDCTFRKECPDPI